MPLDQIVRQKLVRVISSAAVCGLSFSFIIGEAVDSKARQLTQWQSDPSFFPTEFLPLKPSTNALARITVEKVSGLLAEVNQQPMIDSSAPVVQLASAAPTAFTDSLRTILSAPADKLPDLAAKAEPKAKGAKEAVKAAAVEAPAEPVSAAEVERVLSSLHETTALLAQGNGPKLSESVAVIYGSPEMKSEPLGPIYGPEKQEVIEGDSLPTSEMMVIEPEGPFVVAPKKPVATARPSPAEAPKPNNKPWQIRGRVVNARAAGVAGHFEVSLFSKINSEGIPVGFPVAQQILPAGKVDFTLSVPAQVNQGFLFGEFVATKGGKRSWIAPPMNPWPRGERQFAELVMQVEDKVSNVSASPGLAAVANKEETLLVKGTVGTLFARKPIPQEDVVVKVRGRKDAVRTDANGGFRLEIPRVTGQVYLEFLKAGYHPVVVAVPASENGRVVSVEIGSRDAVEQIARRLGIRQMEGKGVFLGRSLGAKGESVSGLALRLSTKADGPFYFTADGVPSTEPRATTADGRFLFFNVEPGTGFVESSLNGETIAPFVLSTVEGGELVARNLRAVSGRIEGRLFNPVSGQGKLQPVAGARLRVEGSADWSTTDSYGAFSLGPMKWMAGERVSVEFSAARYNNHRYLLAPEEKMAPLNLYAFPANYLGRLAASMDVDLDSAEGVVLGKVSGLSVRIDAMADHSAVNGAKDFYFDSTGKLRGSHATTDPRFGTYVIFNVPKGRTLLQGNDASGILRYSDSVISSPASVSVIMD